MANENAGLIGRKVGMTQIYTEQNALIGVTVVDVSGNVVVQVKTASGPDGYNAVQLGFGVRKATRTTRPQKGHFDKAGVAPTQHLKEMRATAEAVAGFTVGQELKADQVFSNGELVDATGTSKGRGFSGVMRRHNFRGFIRSHGTHEYFRHGGSIGTRLTPGMVLKGKKMPGQYGNERSTVQNLKVVRIDADRGLVFVRGGVPGPIGGVVTLRKAVKG